MRNEPSENGGPDEPVRTEAAGTGRRRRPGNRRPAGRAGSGNVVPVVHGVLVGVGGVYTLTLSIPVTVVAAVLAVTLALAVLYR